MSGFSSFLAFLYRSDFGGGNGQIDGETMETVRDFIFLGSKITADGDCSHELKYAGSLEEKL